MVTRTGWYDQLFAVSKSKLAVLPSVTKTCSFANFPTYHLVYRFIHTIFHVPHPQDGRRGRTTSPPFIQENFVSSLTCLRQLVPEQESYLSRPCRHCFSQLHSEYELLQIWSSWSFSPSSFLLLLSDREKIVYWPKIFEGEVGDSPSSF